MPGTQASNSFLQLAQRLSQLHTHDSDSRSRTGRPYAEVIAQVKDAAEHIEDDRRVAIASSALRNHFEGARQDDTHSTENLVTILADATRDVPALRSLFGPPSTGDASERDHKLQTLGDTSPDCVLEVARRIVVGSRQHGTVSEIRSALRLIANCCADNNTNRGIIIHRNGISAMMDMTNITVYYDLLLPTLYNVCIDYNEPWLGDVRLDESNPTITKPGDDDNTPRLNLAEGKLAAYRNPTTSCNAVETLLNVTDRLGPVSTYESTYSILADLVEIASRIALYGLEYLCLDDKPDTIYATSLNLIDSLLSQGYDLAKVNIDCCVSICQALLNILSQPESHRAMLDVNDSIWKFIHLPYLFTESEEDMAALAPYQKAVLKVIYEISALEAYQNKYNPHTRLIDDCVGALKPDNRRKHTLDRNNKPQPTLRPGPYAPICVLLSNMLTSTDRVDSLLGNGTLASYLQYLLHHEDDNDTLLPAVNLATRLALTRKGQDCLHKANVMDTALRLLSPVANAPDTLRVDIQRETITLVRLLIKGRPEYLSTFSSTDPTHVGSSIMTQFESAEDSSRKIEIGRLLIEALLTFASKPSANGSNLLQPESQPPSNFGRTFSTLLRPQNTAKPIAYILTQPQPSSATSQAAVAEAEGWFGLALLSLFPSTNAQLLAILAEDDYALLRALRRIVRHGTQLETRDTRGASASADWEHLEHEQEHEQNQQRDYAVQTRNRTTSMPHTAPPDQETGVQGTKRDAAYENVRVMVLKLVQGQGFEGTGAIDDSGKALSKVRVRSELAAAAEEMGLDWVLV